MKIKLLVIFIFLIFQIQTGFAQEKLHVVLAGLSHDHVDRMLDKNKNGDLIIVGITDADKELCNKKKTGWGLPDSIFFSDIKTALKKTHPDLVMVFNAPAEHLAIAATCLPLHIPVMFEKPLCFSYAQAKKIESLSKQFSTKVYTNFPSQWYKSFNGLLAKREDAGVITKMVMRGGHRGPVEIGCSKNFTNWLTDSVQNGGGALIDFGCYGALAMTELMKGKMPVSVYANTKHLKPSVYPAVDDAATIVLEYKDATGIIEASWNWPYTIMDVELFGNNGYLHASEFNESKLSPALVSKNGKETKAAEMPVQEYKDEVEYLTAVIKGGVPDSNKMLSLEYNLIVVKILDMARKSAKEGRRIVL